ncbi:SMYD5-like protein [Mya arenaria]|uniref:SMYD5-like protein n=1 Tax=Mya arenaria TaxID=6604 RepID=A0ABY7FLK2_MYAAR|nr:SMYD5-like protein [Mya arenaria]
MATLTENVEVKVKESRKGKGLYARKQINEGETILEETPMVCCQFAWNELYKYTACENCLRSLEKAEAMARRLTENPALDLPHLECCEVKVEDITYCPACQVPYCSTECRDQAWAAYHRVLCLGSAREDPEHPVNRLMEAWRNIHFPPETATIMLLLKMIAMVKQDQWLTPEGFRSMFALMGTNQQGIGSSSISVWARNCDDLDLSESDKNDLDKVIDQLYDDLDREFTIFIHI